MFKFGTRDLIWAVMVVALILVAFNARRIEQVRMKDAIQEMKAATELAMELQSKAEESSMELALENTFLKKKIFELSKGKIDLIVNPR